MSGNSFQDINPSVPALAAQQLPEVVSSLAGTDQARAVAEVQAALTIAQCRPRNELRARERLIQACQRTTLAEAAVYQFPRGGQSVTAPSIRLAEVAARCFGNMTYGFRELSRRQGESECEAFAWDLETNTKAIRQFAVRHLRDKRSGPVALTDERDIYEMIANQAQRRVRATILEIIPGDIIDDAMAECEKTKKAALGNRPQAEIIKDMIAAFAQFGVGREAIEKRLGHRLDSVQAGEVLGLKRIWSSIHDGFSTAAEWFEMQPETADLNAKVFDQQPQQPQPTEAGPGSDQQAQAASQTRNKPTQAEMDQRREEAKAAVLASGLEIETVEKELNAYQPKWTTAQCERAHKLAEKATAQREAQPQAQDQTQAAETVECPNSGVMVRLAVECAGCDQMGLCPATDGEAA